MSLKKQTSIDQNVGKQKIADIKIQPIDEHMRKLMDEKQKQNEKEIIDTHAKQAYQNAKKYIDSQYRNTSVPIVSFIFDDKYEYTYDSGKYVIAFKVTVSLQNGSFINKQFYFYMNEDDTQPIGNVWKILDYEEENI
jgi:hypothetical protein